MPPSRAYGHAVYLVVDGAEVGRVRHVDSITLPRMMKVGPESYDLMIFEEPALHVELHPNEHLYVHEFYLLGAKIRNSRRNYGTFILARSDGAPVSCEEADAWQQLHDIPEDPILTRVQP